MALLEPRVSIGLPVYQGEAFLEEAIESILNQSYGNFELIISDNASTDGTRAICENYVRQDYRIRFVQSDVNRGGAWNYNRVFALAQGEYFKWAAHDDVLDPRFLERCLEAFEANSSAVLTYPETTIIDHNGVPVRHLEYPLDLTSKSVCLRFRNYLKFFSHVQNFHCNPVFGLIRTEILRDTSLIGAFPGSDKILLGALVLLGPFEMVSEHLFFRRDHVGRPIYTHKGRKAQSAWFDPKAGAKVTFPHWRWLCEYLRAVSRAPLKPQGKLCCLLMLARFTNPKDLLLDWKAALRDRKVLLSQYGSIRAANDRRVAKQGR